MATVTPGAGRIKPEQHKWTPDFNFALFTDWPFEDTKTWSRRTAVRPTHLRPGTPPDIKRQRIKLTECSKKWGRLSKEQKDAWKIICVIVTRTKHRGATHKWQVRGRKAFMASCLLGKLNPCEEGDYRAPTDLIDPITGLPIDYITPLSFSFKIIDINKNPVNKAKVQITSKALKEKDGTWSIRYTSLSGIDGYPLSYQLTESLRPYDIAVTKTYESQVKTVNVTADTQIDLIIC